ncbi:hypothetical protein FRC04_002249 [Tulasnella sp. 424]|nr:hypothetical protein FRC04_002249 [Tulasnella sp. 424]KAG8977324.1 hypothetical protein FRC05_001722 [Tulasnella sp. 425]
MRGHAIWSAGAIVVVLLFSQCAFGSVTVSVSCKSSAAWLSNQLGQSPCAVYGYISSVCTADQNWVVTRPKNATYDPPSRDIASACQCNTVAYNLMEACGYCQGAQIGDWKSWIANCPAAYVSKEYKQAVPSETVIPPWALEDSSQAGTWDPAVAGQYARPSKKSNLPLIIGASVGGSVGGIILLVAMYFWYRSYKTQKPGTLGTRAATPPPSSFVATTLNASSVPSVNKSTSSINSQARKHWSIPIPAAALSPHAESEASRPQSYPSSRHPSDITAAELGELGEIRQPASSYGSNLI